MHHHAGRITFQKKKKDQRNALIPFTTLERRVEVQRSCSGVALEQHIIYVQSHITEPGQTFAYGKLSSR